MKRIQLEIIIVFALSLAVRLLIFFPSFIQGGDLGQFTTFVREIHMAGGLTPQTNLLYFPGTNYIYPPFLFMLVYWLNALVHPGFNAFLVMREILSVGAVASALTATLIYGITRSEKARSRNLAIGIMTVLFMPDLYALSWGGDPFVLGEFLFVATLFFLSRRSDQSYLWIAGSAITMIIVALSHDLTWFVAVFSFIVLFIYDLIRGHKKLLLMELIPFISGVSVGLIWWIPRIRFVYDAFFVTQSSGFGSYNSLSGAGSYILVFIPFSLVVISIAAYSLLKSDIKLSEVVWDPFVIALVSSLIFLVFIFKSPTLGGRIMYYSIILGTIVVFRFYGITSGPLSSGSDKKRTRWNLKSIRFVILAIVVISIPFQVATISGSVNHYESGYYQYDGALLAWGQSTNLGNGTVIAPNIGNYISAVDGVPVIVYGNFLVGGKQIDQRNAAISIVTDPSSQQSVSYIHQYNVSYVVVSQKYINETGNPGLFPPNMYTKVFSDKYYLVEKYTGS